MLHRLQNRRRDHHRRQESILANYQTMVAYPASALGRGWPRPGLQTCQDLYRKTHIVRSTHAHKNSTHALLQLTVGSNRAKASLNGLDVLISRHAVCSAKRRWLGGVGQRYHGFQAHAFFSWRLYLFRCFFFVYAFQGGLGRLGSGTVTCLQQGECG